MQMEIVFFLALGVLFIITVVSYRSLTKKLQSVVDKKDINDTLFETRLNTQSQIIDTSLNRSISHINTLISNIKDELNSNSISLRKAESERSRSTGYFTSNIENLNSKIERLNSIAVELLSILGNNKLRGKFGEQSALAVLESIGLRRDKDFTYNQAFGIKSNRPDFVINLPDGYSLCIDAKFPLSNYIKGLSEGSEDEKTRNLKQFERDLKNRVKEVSIRDYINPENRTLDFAIIYIPNESILTYIESEIPDILDYSLKHKIILTGPFSLGAIISIIRQSWKNYLYLEKVDRIRDSILGLEKEITELEEGLDKQIRKSEELTAGLQKIRNSQVSSVRKQLTLSQEK